MLFRTRVSLVYFASILFVFVLTSWFLLECFMTSALERWLSCLLRLLCLPHGDLFPYVNCHPLSWVHLQKWQGCLGFFFKGYVPWVERVSFSAVFCFFPISSAFHTTEIDHTPAWHADLSFRFTGVTFSTQGWTSAPCHFLRLVGSSIFWPPFQEQGSLLRPWNVRRSCPAPQSLTGLSWMSEPRLLNLSTSEAPIASDSSHHPALDFLFVSGTWDHPCLSSST